jgi:hypothetical protein
MLPFQKKIAFCGKCFFVRSLCFETGAGHFADTAFRRRRFADVAFRRRGVSPIRRFADTAFRRLSVSPTRRFADKTLSPTRRFADSAFR